MCIRDRIKADQRYIDYLDAEKKLYIPENKSLLKTYQSKLDEYEELKDVYKRQGMISSH